jgi:hypothetical protein
MKQSQYKNTLKLVSWTGVAKIALNSQVCGGAFILFYQLCTAVLIIMHLQITKLLPSG